MDLAATAQTLPNGGFPELAPGIAARMVAVVHQSCGAVTGIRLPAVLPSRAVRRVSCSGCNQTYECRGTVELGFDLEPAASRAGERSQPRLGAARGRFARRDGENPRSRAIRLSALPVAAIAVLGIMLATRDADVASQASGESAASSGAVDSAARTLEKAGANAKMIRGASYSLALPPRWQQVEPSAGAGFAAVSADGDADATLWIERDPGLSFAEFEQRSLAQLEQLAGSAQVVERVSAPSEEDSIVRLAADAPADAPLYEVVLRVAGPYRYYLATTSEPGAGERDAEALELIAGSFVPTPGGGSGS